MNLAKFRRVYNKNDSKAIGKQLNIPSNESVTPLTILSNTAAQLNGPSRTVGGVVIGYLGVRTFQPMPVSKSIEHIGGVPFLLGLVAMSNDIEFMYASVKAFLCIIKSNAEIAREMERINGYQLLGMLYKHKRHLINSHILNLTFSLVIGDDTGKEQACITNVRAFEYLLCDLEIWYDSAPEIQRSMHERFNELLSEQQQVNSRLFHRFGMLRRLLFMIKEPARCPTLLNEANFKLVLSTIRILIVESSQPDDLVRFGQYLVSILSESSINENTLLSSHLTTGVNLETLDLTTLPFPINSQVFNLIYTIKLRNRLLCIVDDMCSQTPTTNKSLNFQEELQRLLGYDWFLVFMQPHVHRTTIVKSVKILFSLLLNMQNLIRFKDSYFAGGWLNTIQIQLKMHQQQQQQSATNSTASTVASVSSGAPPEPATSVSSGNSLANSNSQFVSDTQQSTYLAGDKTTGKFFFRVILKYNI